MIFGTIELNGITLLRPSDMELTREYVYAGEITTCTGKTIADLIGWKYANVTLKWDILPAAQVQALLSLNGSDVLMRFMDADGVQHSERVIPRTHSVVGTRLNGTSQTWHNIETEVSFINVHTNN